MNPFLLGYVGVVAALIAVATVHNVFNLNASEWASWVQAIGSIGAIVGAFLIASYQGRQQERARQTAALVEAADMGDIVVAICIDVLRALSDSAETFSRHRAGESFVAETDRLDEAQHSLRMLLGRRIPAQMMLPLLRIQRTVTYSQRAIRQRAGTSRNLSERTIRNAEGRHRVATAELSSLAKIRNELRARIKIN